MVSVASLFAATGLSHSAPLAWGERPPPTTGQGVYLIALTDHPWGSEAHVAPPPLPDAIRDRWVRGAPALYIGQTRRALSYRLAQFFRHRYGRSSPHRGGQAVLLLDRPLWVYWAETAQPKHAEHVMIAAFFAAAGRLPFANRVRPGSP